MAKLFLTPSKIISGPDALNLAKETIATCGKKAFIVTDKIMVKLKNLDKVTNVLDELKIAYHVYDEVNSEPTDIIVNNGVEAFKKSGCDFLLALGGGSPIDTMKAIAIMINYDKPMNTLMGVNYNKEVLPMIAIPTTAGTGSEATQFTIISDTTNDVKMLLKGEVLIPKIAIIDPVFTMSAPNFVTAATGVDALCHAVESYTSRKSQPLSETFALSAIKRIFTYLPICYKEPTNVEARTQMSLAALEAGISFNNSSVTVVHGMSRPIGAIFHIAHGLSNAMLVESCLNYVADAAYDRFATIARYCDMTTSTDDKEATEVLLKHLSELLVTLEIPTFKQYNIDEEKYKANISKMADDALTSGSPANTIKELSKEDIVNIYNIALNK